jgi:hypothetical protein
MVHLLHYPVEQQFDLTLYLLEHAMEEVLDKLNEERDKTYEEVEEQMRKKGKKQHVEDLYIHKKAGDIAYFLARKRDFPKIKAAWEELIEITLARSYTSWPEDVKRDEKLREKFLNLTNIIIENLERMKKHVEIFLSDWLFQLTEYDIPKERLLNEIRHAQDVIMAIRQHAYSTRQPEPIEEKSEETPQVGSVKKTIDAIKRTLLGLLSP